MNAKTYKKTAVFFRICIGALLLCSLIFVSCNKKYYQGVAKAKDDDSKFIVLKTGEKIGINAAKMHSSSGTIVSIDRLDGKDFDKKDIVILQNNTAYYKKFSFPTYGNCFAERTNKGAINVYLYVATVYSSFKGRHSFIYHTVLENAEIEENIVYVGEPDDKQKDKLGQWFGKSEAAMKIVDNWQKLSKKAKSKYYKNVFEEAAIKYNEEFSAGILKS